MKSMMPNGITGLKRVKMDLEETVQECGMGQNDSAHDHKMDVCGHTEELRVPQK
jgi:hypothetical protein